MDGLPDAFVLSGSIDQWPWSSEAISAIQTRRTESPSGHLLIDRLLILAGVEGRNQIENSRADFSNDIFAHCLGQELYPPRDLSALRLLLRPHR